MLVVAVPDLAGIPFKTYKNVTMSVCFMFVGFKVLGLQVMQINFAIKRR